METLLGSTTLAIRRIGLLQLRTLFWLAAFFVGSILSSDVVIANNLDRMHFVTRNYRGADVLRVDATLETSFSSSFGITRVTVSNPKRRSPADRRLVVVYYVNSWESGEGAYAFSREIVLKEGQKEVSVEFPHCVSTQFAWDVALYEGGRDIEDKRQYRPNTATFAWAYNRGEGAVFGSIVGKGESAKVLSEELRGVPRVANATGQAAGYGDLVRPVRFLPIADCGSDWRYYLTYSAWIVSVDTIAEMLADHPQSAKALQRYVAAGGVLMVHSVDTEGDWDSVSRLLNAGGSQDPQLAKMQRAGWESRKARKMEWWWREPEYDKMPQKGEEVKVEPGLSTDGILYDSLIASETYLQARWGGHFANLEELDYWLGVDEMELETPDIDIVWDDRRNQFIEQFDSEEILVRRYLNGSVILAEKPPAELDEELVSDSLTEATRWNATSLTAPSADGSWFWSNLIAAVGKPPVWTFCVMVGLFGAIIGPGLLFLTGRIGRRSLMLFMVPVLAFTATAAIVVYGILHEGFDTHIRVTSLTVLDDELGQGFTWSRQNFFSGAPPRQGISLPTDTFVRDVFDDSSNNRSYGDPRDSVRCRIGLSEVQNWRGWLRSRQQQQMLLGHPIDQPRSPIRIAPDASGRIQIENLTEDELPFVVARGAGDDYYFWESVGPGATLDAESEEQRDVGASVARLFVPLKPEPPPELMDGGSLMDFDSARRMIRGGNTSDVIGHAMQTHFSDKLYLPKFGYATVLKTNDKVLVPLEGKRSEGLHLVVGVQPW